MTISEFISKKQRENAMVRVAKKAAYEKYHKDKFEQRLEAIKNEPYEREARRKERFSNFKSKMGGALKGIATKMPELSKQAAKKSGNMTEMFGGGMNLNHNPFNGSDKPRKAKKHNPNGWY